jgi:hypothetical protein
LEESMKIRAAVAASLSVALGVPGVASSTASRPKVCKLITDPTGDTFVVNTQDLAKVYGPQDDALDITSVDLASNTKWVTAVVRVVHLDTAPTIGPYGAAFEVSWRIPGVTDKYFFLGGWGHSTTTEFTVGWRDSALTSTKSHYLGDAYGTFDPAKNEVRISAPVALFSAFGRGMKPGTKISFNSLQQYSYRWSIASAYPADEATSEATYITGTPSCVTPGK